MEYYLVKRLGAELHFEGKEALITYMCRGAMFNDISFYRINPPQATPEYLAKVLYENGQWELYTLLPVKIEPEEALCPTTG